MILMAFRMVHPFQKVFSWLCSDPSVNYVSYSLIKCISFIINLKVKISLWSMGYRMDTVLASVKATLILLCISTRVLTWPDALSVSHNIFFKGHLFSEQYVSTISLKYLVNHVVSRCAVIQALLVDTQNTGREPQDFQNGKWALALT